MVMGESKRGYDKIRFCGDQAPGQWIAILLGGHLLHQQGRQHRASRGHQLHVPLVRNATRCYVYLADISTPSLDAAGKPTGDGLSEIQMVHRGDGLFRELIAPGSVDFFSREGVWRDGKSLKQHIHHIYRSSSPVLEAALHRLWRL